MNIFNLIFPIIVISIILNVVSKAAKSAKQGQNPFSQAQQALRQQAQQHQQNTTRPQEPIRLEKEPLQAPGLTRAREGAPLNRYTLEGTTLEGTTLEGISLENAKSPDRITPSTDHSSYEITHRRKGSKRSGYGGNGFINQKSILNGIIMSEVLSSRGGRKRSK